MEDPRNAIKTNIVKFLSIVCVVCMILMGVSLRSSWVYQYYSENSYWQGDLTKVLHGLGELNGKSYKELSDIFCELSESLQQGGYYWGEALAWCSMFDNLHRAGSMVNFLEPFAVFCMLYWTVALCFCLKSSSNFKYSYLAGGLTFGMHYLGYLGFSLGGKVIMSGDCYVPSDGANPAELCAESGFRIAHGLSIGLLIFLGLSLVILRVVKLKVLAGETPRIQVQDELPVIQEINLQSPSENPGLVVSSFSRDQEIDTERLENQNFVQENQPVGFVSHLSQSHQPENLHLHLPNQPLRISESNTPSGTPGRRSSRYNTYN